MKTRRVIVVIILAVLLAGLAAFLLIRVSNPWNARTLGGIPAPMGYTRVQAEKGSYTEFLRGLPLKKPGSSVHLFTGGKAHLQWLSTGVVDLPVLSNSEQCADMTMRLRGEYLWKTKQYSKIKFTDVNGKPQVYTGGADRKLFESYMKRVYGCCSTYSVHRETKPREVKDVQPGDVFVYPSRHKGRMGHAVIVVDVARSRSGKVAVMCVEGNTPAREAHVVRNLLNPFRNPWFMLSENADRHSISVFQFKKEELRHY